MAHDQDVPPKRPTSPYDELTKVAFRDTPIDARRHLIRMLLLYTSYAGLRDVRVPQE